MAATVGVVRWALPWLHTFPDTVSVGPDLRIAELEAPGLRATDLEVPGLLSTADISIPLLLAGELEVPGLRTASEWIPGLMEGKEL